MSSSERGNRLLQGETAGKQLITDNANVLILGASQLPHHLNDGSCTFSSLSCQHRGLLSMRAYGCICTATCTASVHSCLYQACCRDSFLSVVETTLVLLK